MLPVQSGDIIKKRTQSATIPTHSLTFNASHLEKETITNSTACLPKPVQSLVVLYTDWLPECTDFVVDWVAAYCCTVLMCIGAHDAVMPSEASTEPVVLYNDRLPIFVDFVMDGSRHNADLCLLYSGSNDAPLDSHPL